MNNKDNYYYTEDCWTVGKKTQHINHVKNFNKVYLHSSCGQNRRNWTTTKNSDDL